MIRHNARSSDARRSRSRAGVLGGLVLLSALTLCSLPSSAQDSAFVAAMREGRAAYKASDWATAEKHFDAAAKASENDKQKSTAFYALGVVAQKQNKLPEAKQRAEQALAINPGDKLSKGLLDEVNAASVPPAKGKGKPAAKGLAKTPYEPGSKQAATAAAAKAGQQKAAGNAAKVVAPKGAPPKAAKPPAPADNALPPGKSGALEAPAAAEAARVAELPAPPADAKPVDKPVEKPETVAEAAQGATPVQATGTKSEDSSLTPATTAAIVTGALPDAKAALPEAPPAATVMPTAAVMPVSATSPKPLLPAETAVPLPHRARYVETSCGPDYRADGKLFARALEVTGGAEGQGEVLTFDLACASRNGAPSPSAELIPEGNGGQIRLARLQRAPEGGWIFADDAGARLARFRPEAEFLVLLPSDGEVAVLRRQLARDPAQIESLPAEVRRDLERAVAGEGYPGLRIVRTDDRLDSAFDQARKLAKRTDDSAVSATTN